MLDIVEATEDAMYSSVLQEVIHELGGLEILRLAFGPEEVDIDVLLEDGRVFCYEYNKLDCAYWYCIEEKFVREEMQEEVAVFYTSLKSYAQWTEQEREMARD